MSLEYVKAEKINVSDYYDEKWIQDKIEEDPSLIGLGDLEIVKRERRQSTGGRIDFLLHDPEIETMYEVEIQLGPTNESHIIRTIEYCDIEKRRFPNKDHKAVIIAEDITSRFFNVISIMNKSIPVIAIQLNAIKIENKICLVFTKVLDIFEEPEDEVDLGGETVDRRYWENHSNPKSITLMDKMIAISKEMYENPKVTYNKHHVALGTLRRNYAWFRSRVREGYCQFDVRLGRNNIDKTKKSLEEIGLPFSLRRDDTLAISIQTPVFEENKEFIKKLFLDACEMAK